MTRAIAIVIILIIAAGLVYCQNRSPSRSFGQGKIEPSYQTAIASSPV